MSHICKKIHHLFNELPRHNFSFNKETIPQNGIYILFEKGEIAHGVERIVRIGTHTGENQLRSRLKQHFISENKDRSIFRKNIGRALLAKQSDPFLEQWEWDLTTKANKEKYLPMLNSKKQLAVEKLVSAYMHDAFSFVVFEVNSKEQRLEFESKIISTVSLCNDCKPSFNWLGLHSPKSKIQKSGLWLVNELYKEPLDDEGFAVLERLYKKLD
jgi:hypothetical protein